jgi:hypothetical protein
MYLLSIVVAWLAAPRDRESADGRQRLRRVITASMLEGVRRRERARTASPRGTWPRAL